MKKIRLTSLGLLILASLFSLQAIASITGKAGDPPSDKGKEDEVPAEASRTETRPILLRKATKTQSASAPQLQDTTERTGGSGRGIEPERGIGRGVNPEPRVVGRGADLNHRPTVNGVGRGRP